MLFHVVSDGGHNKNQTLRSTLVTFEDDVMTFKGINDNGSQAYVKTVKASDNSSPAPKAEVEKKEEVVEEVPQFKPIWGSSSSAFVFDDDEDQVEEDWALVQEDMQNEQNKKNS